MLGSFQIFKITSWDTQTSQEVYYIFDYKVKKEENTTQSIFCDIGVIEQNKH